MVWGHTSYHQDVIRLTTAITADKICVPPYRLHVESESVIWITENKAADKVHFFLYFGGRF